VKRIGVVEDNPDNRLLLRAILEDQYNITEFESGREALEGFRESKPDLVLLDISLPEMDGPEVLEHMRADDILKDLPALTAHAMAGDRDKFLSMGFDEYVTKPIVDETVLFSAIEKFLD
jgi:CheY-like chemotaxis protein